jgi:hypothetical protein
MTAPVQRFEDLAWRKCVLNGGAFYEADAGDALLQPWEHGACIVMNGDRRFKYDLPDLPTAKRAAWDLLCELRRKAATTVHVDYVFAADGDVFIAPVPAAALAQAARAHVDRELCDECCGRTGRYDTECQDQWYSCQACHGTGLDGATKEEAAAIEARRPKRAPTERERLYAAQDELAKLREENASLRAELEAEKTKPIPMLKLDAGMAELLELRAVVERVAKCASDLVTSHMKPLHEDRYERGHFDGMGQARAAITEALGEHAAKPGEKT